MKSDTYPLSRKNDLVVQELDGEILIYDLIKHKAFSLNHIAALVWEACDGNKSVADIDRALGTKFKTPVGKEYVWLALDKLKSEGLLTNSEEIKIDFNGLTRRQVIKRAGLASLVALPVVASLVVPTAAAAQSLVCDCLSNPGLDARLEGCPCAGNNDCCGNCNGALMICNGPLPVTLSPGAVCCPPNIPI